MNAWHLAIICFTLLGFGFLFLIIMAIGAFIRSQVANAKVRAIFCDPKGKFDDHILDVNMFGSSEDWRFQSDNPTKVKFKIKPKGIGRSKDLEWDNDDYFELQSTEGNRRVVFFGVRGLSQNLSIQMRMTKQINNYLASQLSNTKAELDHLKANFWPEVERQAKLAHSFAPKIIKPPKGTTTG